MVIRIRKRIYGPNPQSAICTAVDCVFLFLKLLYFISLKCLSVRFHLSGYLLNLLNSTAVGIRTPKNSRIQIQYFFEWILTIQLNIFFYRYINLYIHIYVYLFIYLLRHTAGLSWAYNTRNYFQHYHPDFDISKCYWCFPLNIFFDHLKPLFNLEKIVFIASVRGSDKAGAYP